MNEKLQNRVEWLDVAKALGIYLVILGHLVIFNYQDFRFIFAFHMPLFFVIAGYVFKNRDEKPFRIVFKSLVKHYLLPLVITLILGVLQCLLVPLSGSNVETMLQKEQLLKAFYYGHPTFSVFGSSWFLIAMFTAQLMFYALRRFTKKLAIWIRVILWITILAIALNVLEIFNFIPMFHRLPLKLDSALMAVCCMEFGYLLSFIKFEKYAKTLYCLLILPISAFGVWFVGCKNNYYVNLCDCEYAKPLHFLIACVCGIFMIFAIAFILKKVKLLQIIGRNTLVIFLSHEAVLALVIWITNKVFHTTYQPQGMQLNIPCVIISIVVFTISTCIALIFNWLKGKVFKSKARRLENRDEKN